MKLEFENNIMSRDLKTISELESTKERKFDLSNQNERNKTFLSLINSMKKATKIISLMDTYVKNLSK